MGEKYLQENNDGISDDIMIQKVIDLQERMQNKQDDRGGYDLELGKEGSSPGAPVI